MQVLSTREIETVSGGSLGCLAVLISPVATCFKGVQALFGLLLCPRSGPAPVPDCPVNEENQI